MKIDLNYLFMEEVGGTSMNVVIGGAIQLLRGYADIFCHSELHCIYETNLCCWIYRGRPSDVSTSRDICRLENDIDVI